VYGPLVLLAADILGRVLGRPGEFPVAFMTAILGAPVLIALMTRRRAVQL
jgi:iron complex transport system permease protein